MLRKVLVAVLATAATLLVAWGALHAFIQPVNPAQEPPSGHASSACWACHIVSASAKTVDIGE